MGEKGEQGDRVKILSNLSTLKLSTTYNLLPFKKIFEAIRTLILFSQGDNGEQGPRGAPGERVCKNFQLHIRPGNFSNYRLNIRAFLKKTYTFKKHSGCITGLVKVKSTRNWPRYAENSLIELR